MKKIAVIYKSKYGTTKQYAEWITGALDAILLEASGVKPTELAAFDVVIYGGRLYAGGIDGVGLVAKNPCKNLVVFTVGLANPKTIDYSEILKKNFGADMLSKTKIFHLRGGMNYAKLGLIDKGLMALMHKATLKKEPSQRSEDDVLLLETYGSKIDFMDKDSICDIVYYVNSFIVK